MNNASVSRISVYPIKSLDGLTVEKAIVNASGSIVHDRQYAIFDSHGKLINGKNTPAIHRLRSKFNQEISRVTLYGENMQSVEFNLEKDRDQLNAFLSDFLADTVQLKENNEGEFLDDPVQSKFTLVSTASLQAIADRFSITLEECRRRFRANIEIDGVPAFWEETLVQPHKVRVPFMLGNLSAEGVKPCPRCVVPSRHPDHGEILQNFQQDFIAFRAETLPGWSPLVAYGHLYQLSVSCVFLANLPDNSFMTGDMLRVSDNTAN